MSLNRVAVAAALVAATIAAAPSLAQEEHGYGKDPLELKPAEIVYFATLEACETENPVTALTYVAKKLPGGTVDRAAIQAMLAQSKRGKASAVHQLLDPVISITRTGSRIVILRSEKTLVWVPKRGAIELDKRVELDLGGYSGRKLIECWIATITDVSGIRVGETTDRLYPLRRVFITSWQDDHRADVTVGRFGFSWKRSYTLPSVSSKREGGVDRSVLGMALRLEEAMPSEELGRFPHIGH